MKQRQLGGLKWLIFLSNTFHSHSAIHSRVSILENKIGGVKWKRGSCTAFYSFDFISRKASDTHANGTCWFTATLTMPIELEEIFRCGCRKSYRQPGGASTSILGVVDVKVKSTYWDVSSRLSWSGRCSPQFQAVHVAMGKIIPTSAIQNPCR